MKNQVHKMNQHQYQILCHVSLSMNLMSITLLTKQMQCTSYHDTVRSIRYISIFSVIIILAHFFNDNNNNVTRYIIQIVRATNPVLYHGYQMEQITSIDHMQRVLNPSPFDLDASFKQDNTLWKQEMIIILNHAPK